MNIISNCIKLLSLLIAFLSVSESTLAAPGKTLWPSNALTKVLRSDIQDDNTNNSLQITAGRAEIVSSQAVFRPHKNAISASFSISNLLHLKGETTIPASAIKLQWVRYIDINRNTGGIPDDELAAKSPTSIPDPFWENSTIPVTAEKAQPIWIEIHVPQNAKPGDYNGKLTVTTEAESFEMPVTLH
ncbi:MAG: DUF6067 family protein, partial [Phycisphaerae bacterium]|nr:DUF6067 family protein [Phycisphaerae bacterium]